MATSRYYNGADELRANVNVDSLHTIVYVAQHEDGYEVMISKGIFKWLGIDQKKGVVIITQIVNDTFKENGVSETQLDIGTVETWWAAPPSAQCKEYPISQSH